jgi:hypothetical protein
VLLDGTVLGAPVSAVVSGEAEGASGPERAVSGENEGASGPERAVSGESEGASGPERAVSGESEGGSGPERAVSGESEGASGPERAVSGESEGGSGLTAERVAFLGLCKLGMRTGEAKQRVRAVLAGGKGRSWTAEDLLRAAILAA